jgi:hypothetical protein
MCPRFLSGRDHMKVAWGTNCLEIVNETVLALKVAAEASL